MLVVGGQAPKAIRSVELYDFKSEKWNHVADMPSRRCRSGLSCLSAFQLFIVSFIIALRLSLRYQHSRVLIPSPAETVENGQFWKGNSIITVASDKEKGCCPEFSRWICRKNAQKIADGFS